MSSDRWRRIEEIFEAVRLLSPEERVQFLSEMSPDDRALRVEIESLLAQERLAEGFLETPAAEEAARLLAGEREPVAPGTRVGAYEIHSLLGAGGMGEVYRAHDARLGRDVAIKILFPLLLSGQDARARFEREARLLASLNHPNIAAIYGVEEFGGGLALVLELVEGPTLASPTGRAERRSVTECLALSAQVAAALEAAHDKGIVHRDLKPANIKVTADGLVKVIDFGLAKFTPGHDLTGLSRHGSTTEIGIVVGTAAYMSPEQARGLVTDKRTDVWAFGVVLYELLCGRAAFAGATTSDTIAAVLQQDPDWTALPSDVPPAIRRLLQRCLEKEAKRRLRDIGDARLEIIDAIADKGSVAASLRAFPTFRWALGMAAAAVAGLSGYVWLTPTSAPAVIRFDRTTISDRVEPWGAMVTDGARLYFLERAGSRLVTVQTAMTGGDAQPAPVPFPNSRIFDISPDHSAFLIGTIGSGFSALPLWTWPVQGGAASRVGSVVADNAEWCPDGQQIVYARGGDVRLVNRDGSRDRDFFHVNGRVDWLRWSPDGRRLDFSVGDLETETTAIWEASADGRDVHPRFTGNPGFSNSCCSIWTPDGKYFLFSGSRDGRFDLWALREGHSFWQWRKPQPVQLTSSPVSVTGTGLIVTPNGLREYAFGFASEFEAARYDPVTHQSQRLLTSTSSLDVALSSDGQWVAFLQSSDWTLWRARVDGTERLRLTNPPLSPGHPRWSPDGKTIAFEGRMPGGAVRAYIVGAGGGAPEEIMPGEDFFAPVWSSDGRSLAVMRNYYAPAASQKPTGIYIVDLGTRRSTKVPGSDHLIAPLWSPDGRSFTARTLDARHLLQFDDSSRKWIEVSSSSSSFGPAAWSADSKYLYTQLPHEPGQPVIRLRAGSFSRDTSVSFESLLTGGIQRCTLEDVAPDGSLILALTRKGTQVYFVDLDVK